MLHIEQYLTRDRTTKEEQLRKRRFALQEKQKDIKSRFDTIDSQRRELHKKLTRLVHDKANAISADVDLEEKNRCESITHIR